MGGKGSRPPVCAVVNKKHKRQDLELSHASLVPYNNTMKLSILCSVDSAEVKKAHQAEARPSVCCPSQVHKPREKDILCVATFCGYRLICTYTYTHRTEIKRDRERERE